VRLARWPAGLMLVCLGASCAGCAGRPAAPASPAPPAPQAPVAFPEGPAPLARYHSKRLALSVPLPNGREWRIDDHSGPELVLRHEPTRSTIVVAILYADELVGRSQCEKLALEHRLLPRGDLQTLEDEVTVTQRTYDTRIRVALAPGARPESPIVGHVVAFGGFLRKCFVFDFATQVDGASGEAVLSSRLAFARARILGGLELDPFAAAAKDELRDRTPPERAAPAPP
jgi:hypothetical protein